MLRSEANELFVKSNDIIGLILGLLLSLGLKFLSDLRVFVVVDGLLIGRFIRVWVSVLQEIDVHGHWQAVKKHYQVQVDVLEVLVFSSASHPANVLPQIH